MREEGWGRADVVEVEAVAVEFLDGGGGYEDAAGVAVLEDVEGEGEGLEEGGREAVVGRGGEG